MRARLVHQLLRPHWKILALAFLALLAQTATGLLEPWPLKLIFDSVLGSNPAPGWMSLGFDGAVGPLWLLNVAAIFVLDAGRIVECGTHEELLEAGGLYAHLHGIQFRGDTAAPAVLS